MHNLIALHTRLLQLEDIFLVGFLVLTIVLASLQILLRNFFDTGIIWGDSFLRIAVLWIGMLGAMYASRDDRHISIDIGMRFLSAHIKPYVQALVFIFTAVICTIVFWYGLQLVLLELEDGQYGFARIPVWLCESIIPFAFMVIAIRYFVAAILALLNEP
ncbi:MAG TPA: TRAP transporter small permease [Acidiferrobacteraceae bacterium]|nr:TRAP transporter small permease [Acidiferrobacteraceae bacterium]